MAGPIHSRSASVPVIAFPGGRHGLATKADALEQSLVRVLTRLQLAATRFSFPNHELSSRRSWRIC